MWRKTNIEELASLSRPPAYYLVSWGILAGVGIIFFLLDWALYCVGKKKSVKVSGKFSSQTTCWGFLRFLYAELYQSLFSFFFILRRRWSLSLLLLFLPPFSTNTNKQTESWPKMRYWKYGKGKEFCFRLWNNSIAYCSNISDLLV